MKNQNQDQKIIVYIKNRTVNKSITYFARSITQNKGNWWVQKYIEKKLLQSHF